MIHRYSQRRKQQFLILFIAIILVHRQQIAYTPYFRINIARTYIQAADKMIGKKSAEYIAGGVIAGFAIYIAGIGNFDAFYFHGFLHHVRVNSVYFQYI